MPKNAPGPATVRVFPMPIGVVSPIEGVPHKVMDVDPGTAARLCAPASRNVDWSVFVDDPALLPAGYQPEDPDGLLSTPTPSED